MIKLFSILCILSISLADTTTVAISYFDNTSGNEKYNPLSKGLADMLITDLSNVKSLQIVEREKLESLLKEIDLGEGKFIDPNTAQSLGKGLGAEFILTGAFLSIDPMMRIDARIMEVGTGKVIGAEEVTGDGNDFFKLEKKLAQLLIERLKLDIVIEDNNPNLNLDAVLNYSEAIDLDDKGFKDEASKKLNKLANDFPDFKNVADKLDEIKLWIEKVSNERSQMKKEMVQSALLGLDSSSPDYNPKLVMEGINLFMGNFKDYGVGLSYIDKIKSKAPEILDQRISKENLMTLDEYARGMEFMFLRLYKNEIDKTIKLGQEFLVAYPTSIYSNLAEGAIKQAINTVENRKKSMEKINNNLPLAIKQFDIEKIYSLMKNDYGETLKNLELYNKIKVKVDEFIIPIINDNWDEIFKKNVITGSEFYFTLNKGVYSKRIYEKNIKVSFLMMYKRIAIVNGDSITSNFLDDYFLNYEDIMYEKNDEELLDDYYLKIEQMEKGSYISDSCYTKPNTIEDLQEIRQSENYGTEGQKIDELIRTYKKIFKIAEINKDFADYQNALGLFKKDPVLITRKKHRREHFQQTKIFQDKKEEFDELAEYFNNREKLLDITLFDIYKAEKDYIPLTVRETCLNLLKYNLKTIQLVELRYMLFYTAYMLDNFEKAQKAYDYMRLDLQHMVDKGSDDEAKESLEWRINSAKVYFEIMPE